MKTIGDRIRDARTRKGMTQDELAKKLGYKNRGTVSKLENSNSISISKVENIAKALDVSPSYLMGWTKELSEVEFVDIHKAVTVAVDLAELNDPVTKEFFSIKKKVKPEIVKKFLDLLVDSYGITLNDEQ